MVTPGISRVTESHGTTRSNCCWVPPDDLRPATERLLHPGLWLTTNGDCLAHTSLLDLTDNGCPWLSAGISPAEIGVSQETKGYTLLIL